MSDPKHAEQNLAKEVHKIVEDVNKKEKDLKVKEKRKLHVHAIAELNLNATIHQTIEESQERIAEMAEKQEEEVANRTIESGQSIDTPPNNESGSDSDAVEATSSQLGPKRASNTSELGGINTINTNNQDSLWLGPNSFLV